jgi:hypothetical protein
MSHNESETVAQYMRVMHVLDCVPGYAGDPKKPEPPNGYEPIAILTMSYKNEVEQPIMLSMRDTQKLLTSLHGVLAHHTAELEDSDRHDISDSADTSAPPTDPNAWPADWDEENEDDWIAKAAADVAKDDPPRLGGLPSTGIKMRIQHTKGKPPTEYEVFGGFTDGKTKVVLYRFYEDSPRHPADSILRFDSKDCLIPGCAEPEECLLPREWRKFGRLRGGGRFRINGHEWKKMSLKQVRQWIEHKVF